MHLTHCHKTCQEIRLFLGIGLAGDALVAFAGSTGLIRIDPGDQDQLVLDLLIDSCQTIDVVTYGILVISGAGSDDHKEFIAFAGENITDLGVSFFFDLG